PTFPESRRTSFANPPPRLAARHSDGLLWKLQGNTENGMDRAHVLACAEHGGITWYSIVAAFDNCAIACSSAVRSPSSQELSRWPIHQRRPPTIASNRLPRR